MEIESKRFDATSIESERPAFRVLQGAHAGGRTDTAFHLALEIRLN